MEVGTNPNNEFGLPILLDLVKNGSNDLIDLYQQKSGNLHILDANGRNALHYAASHGQLKVARFLVSLGVDRFAKDKDGNTPLDVVKESERAKFVELLQERKEVNHKSDLLIYNSAKEEPLQNSKHDIVFQSNALANKILSNHQEKTNLMLQFLNSEKDIELLTLAKVSLTREKEHLEDTLKISEEKLANLKQQKIFLQEQIISLTLSHQTMSQQMSDLKIKEVELLKTIQELEEANQKLRDQIVETEKFVELTRQLEEFSKENAALINILVRRLPHESGADLKVCLVKNARIHQVENCRFGKIWLDLCTKTETYIASTTTTTRFVFFHASVVN